MPEDIINSKTALLVMDFQNILIENYLSPESATSLLENTANLINRARDSGIPVIYVTVGFRPGYPEVHTRNSVFAAVKEHGVFVVGSNGAAIHNAVAPLGDEPVIIKHRIGAFSFTDLEMILKAKGTDTLILTGITTSGVVLSTLRQGFDLDYKLLVAKDCCADPDMEMQVYLMDKVLPAHARVLMSKQII